MKQAKYQILNTFILKILACVFMTLDHIGKFLISYMKPELSISQPEFWQNSVKITGYVFQCVGRLALPIFLILFVEAMRHTKSKESYLSRLGIMALLILIVSIIFTYTMNFYIEGNIFLTFVCAGTFIYCLEKKDWKKYLMIIPLLYICLATARQCLSLNGIELLWFPKYLIPDYSLYGFILAVLFYYAYKVTDAHVLKLSDGQGRTLDELKTYPYYRTYTNLVWVIILISVNIIFWVISYIQINSVSLDIYNAGIQNYSIIAIVFFAMYNGKKGYTKPSIKYFFYAYYPLHLILIFLIFKISLGY